MPFDASSGLKMSLSIAERFIYVRNRNFVEDKRCVASCRCVQG